MLHHAEGGMSVNDLQELIDRRIPDNRNQLETSHENLAKVAEFCKKNYVTSRDQPLALEETKQYAIQSLASVAYQINKMAVDLHDMLAFQTEKVDSLVNQVQYVGQVVDVHKEKLARREIGALTTNKTLFKQPKIIAPAVQEPKLRYQRTPIDYSILDGIGHGVRSADQSRGGTLISRATSSVSGSSPSQYHNDSPAYGVFSGERTATLGRTMRPYAPSIAPSDYRLPQMSSQSESRMTRQISHGSEFGDHLSGGGGSGSQHGSSDYNSIYQQDRYGTIRAGGRTTIDGGSVAAPRLPSAQSSAGPESPTFPLPPPQISSMHYNGYVAPGSVVQQQQQPYQPQNYGTIRKSTVSRSDLPPPPSSVLTGNRISIHDDMDDLPPPPESVGGSSAYGVFSGGRSDSYLSSQPASLFDTSAGWMPNEYLEKVRVLYDYDAQKEDELTLRENSIVYVLKKNDDDWYEGVLDGVTGLFPGNYVVPL
ncbi:CRE-ABI-1 protein [Caenorhabditis remanei]|uniref:CRE-ABI-1 protein n=1 Tax=Caenorhabditis remanei TaxID=31234 RepID=E3LYY2_CAERE|nr:CRE-ABI-1 protein [Caenorhabditis remanei]